MFDPFYWTTPNGHKITIFLEEAGLPYKSAGSCEAYE
jgi:GST-like protein